MRKLRRAANRHASSLLLIGLAVIALANLRKRRDDKRLASRILAEMAGPRPALKAMPCVSILVAAWNEADVIERHIASVQALRYPHKEYIVCAGGPDGTYELARRHAGPGIQVLEQHPGEGKQASLRRALQHASGEIIFLTDSDCLLDDDGFERVLAGLVNHDDAVAASGGIRPCPEQRRNPFVFHQWSQQVYALWHMPESVTGLVGANCAVRRDALLASGALDDAVASGTDYYLAKRLLANGGVIVHVAAATASTGYPESWRAYRRQQSRWLRNVALHGARFGAFGEVRAALRTSLIGLVMTVLPVAALWVGPVALTLWLLAFTQAYAGKQRYYELARTVAGGDAALPGAMAAAVYTAGEFPVWTAPLLQLVMWPWKPLSW